MNPEEYKNLNRVERDHWYYSGKRDIARHWLERIGLKINNDQLLADCGAGTGAFAVEMLRICRVAAVDDYPESLEILRTRLPGESVYQGSCTDLPFPDASVDYITALDVLEHIEDDHAAMREMWRVLKPGGGMVVTVPALMSLWSDWDVSLRHFRRYDRASLMSLMRGISPQIVECNYMNFFAFPAVWTLRRLRGAWGEDAGGRGRAEDKVPPLPVNSLLRAMFIWSSCQTFIHWPFGVGLLGVMRKPIA